MLIQKLKSQITNPFVKNLGWLSTGEFVNRVMRLATVVVLARKLTPEDFGIIAILLGVIEFSNTPIYKGGVAAKLIHADEKDLDVLSTTAYWVNWLLCISIFASICLLSFPISLFYGNNNLIAPICFVSLPYLICPFYAIQDALIQRENRMKICSIAGIANSVIGNSLTVIFALLNFGFWSVALATVISHVSWFTIYRNNHSWRCKNSFRLDRWQEIFHFAKYPLGIELFNKFRANIDYILVGRFLGVEQLGLYFFAFSAGLGLILNGIGMIATSLFPYLCKFRSSTSELKFQYYKSLKIIALIFLPIVLFQTILAPFYIPIIFGQKWVIAIPIFMIICLSGLPRPFASAAEQLLIVVDKGKAGLTWNFIFTTVFVIILLIAAQWNIYAVAATVLLVHLILLPLFALWANQLVFSSSPKS